MLKMPDDIVVNETEDPHSPTVRSSIQENGLRDHQKTPLGWLKQIFKQKPDSTLRETIEELIEEPENFEHDPASAHERILLSNILKLRDISVVDVMVPRAEIIALNIDTPQEELFALLAEGQFSRIPVYRETLDDVLGTIHIKDILSALAKNEAISIHNLMSDVPIVSPAMPIPDLGWKRKKTRRHMAMVVDEYGGIDGLVTLGDVIESIVGEIDDEHDTEEPPAITQESDGSLIADARLDIEEFEECYGKILSEEEREESDTLGGLVFSIAGRIPARGEILTHDSGMIFEVLEAGPRRINRLRIRNIP